MDRLTYVGVQGYAVGVDINTEIIDVAKKNFPEMLSVCADCEADNFVETLYTVVPSTIQFDVVVLSMVLLHVKEPLKVLKNVYKVLKPGGTVYVRDMDDGLSVAYPDTDGTFARIRRICEDVKYTGYRTNGREIYGLLQKTGFTSIKNTGIKVDVTMAEPNDYAFRENLFTINFGFIPGDLELACKDDPSKYTEDYLWLKRTGYDALNDMFHTAEFYYRMGLIGFCAKKN
jgi:SAM-dependent methyltransferase